MNFTRPELIEIFIKIYGAYYYTPKVFDFGIKRTSIFDFFGINSIEYKNKFIKYIDKKDKRVKFEDIKTFQDKEDFNNQFFTNYKRSIKIGDYFINRNTFNIFYIIYIKGKSINKYGLKRYIFKEYLELNNISLNKLEKLKEIAIKFYEEDDITKYIYGNINFIYSNYSEQELDVLYKMGLFIKEENIKNNIFDGLDGFRLYDLLDLDVNIEERIKKGKIFSDDIIYNCFLYFYKNTDSFRKYKTRRSLIKDFLEKKYIGVDSSIKHIGILLNYMRDLDEIFSTPFSNLLDIFMKFNNECKDEYHEINKEADVIYSEIELHFLSIFYNIDKIKGYKYYENIEYMDSKYLEKDDDNKEGDLGFSHVDYNNLFN